MMELNAESFCLPTYLSPFLDDRANRRVDAAVADQPDIQARVFHNGKCTSHRVVDPSVSISEGSTAQPGQ